MNLHKMNPRKMAHALSAATHSDSRMRGAVKGAALAAGVSLLFPGYAAAQLEEVLVTAQKREEGLQDVGLSVQAISADAMERAGLTDISRLELIGAGVQYGFYGQDAKVAIRGSSSNNTYGDNTSVAGLFVDGVYKPRASQQSRAFFDVERLEVLKGPQGTLYGRNTFGGAINLHTNKPDLESAGGEIAFTSATFNATRTEFMYNRPLSDAFGLRLAGVVERSDGWIKNRAEDGNHLGADDNVSLRLSALWQPSDSVEIIGRLNAAEEKGTFAGLFSTWGLCRPVTYVDDPTTDADDMERHGLTDPFGADLDCQNPRDGAAPTPDYDDLGAYEIEFDYTPRGRLFEDNVTLEVNIDFASSALKYITSYTDFGMDSAGDIDYSASGANRGSATDFAESWTHELTLVSTGDSRFQWTLGGYYSEDTTRYGYYQYRHASPDNSSRQALLINKMTGDRSIAMENALATRRKARSDYIKMQEDACKMMTMGACNSEDGMKYDASRDPKLIHNEKDENFVMGAFDATLDNRVPDAYAELTPQIGTPLATTTVRGEDGAVLTDDEGNVTGQAYAPRVYGGRYAEELTTDITVLGLFGQVEIGFSDSFRAVAGIRYNSEEKEGMGGASNYTNLPDGEKFVTFRPPPVNGPLAGNPTYEYEFNYDSTLDLQRPEADYDETTYRFGLELDLGDSAMLYGTFSTGFLSGALSHNGGVTDPQTSEAWEIGLKSRMRDDRLQLNLAAHFTTYDNLLTSIQTTRGDVVSTTSVNGGDIETLGFEVELLFLPVDAFQIAFNFAWQDAEFQTFGSTNPFQMWRGLPNDGGFVDLAGERAPFTPEYSYNLSALYDISLGENGTLTPSLQHAWSDEYSNHGFNLPDLPGGVQDAYSKTDFRLTWVSSAEEFSVQAFVENIEDEVVSARSQTGGNDRLQSTPLYPRNYGMKFKYTF